MENKILVFLGRLSLAAAIVLSTFVATTALKKIRLGVGTIKVKGCAEKEIQSDYVTWQGSLNVTGETQVLAYEKLEKDQIILHHYLQQQGIALKNVVFSPIHTIVNYHRNDQGYLTNHVASFHLRQGFSISSADITQITKVSQNITTLIKEGLFVESNQPQYFYVNIDRLKIAMLGEAAKDARLRAEELVSKSGSHVGILRDAHQGVFQITPLFSSSTSDCGEYDTSSISKKIKAVVTMEYAID